MILSLALPLALAAAPSPCPPGTTVVMSCPAKKKHIAVCIDAAAKPKYAQYRFGPLATITTSPELAVPQDPKEGFSRFIFARRDLASGTSATLSFNNGDVGYEVYTQDGRDAGGGVNVTQKGKLLASIACTGDFEEHWEKLEPHVLGDVDLSKLDLSGLDLDGPAGGGKAPTSGGPKPDPTAGKSMKDICNDDVLLLTKYKWDDLRFNGAFNKNCCVKGALGTDDDRCQFDWPTNDVPECGFFDEMRNAIFARYGYVFKDPKWQQTFGAKDWYQPRSDFSTSWMPKVATDNANTLKVFACPKPVTKATCDKAGLNWSVQLQKASKGQMDGVQQSEIADGLAALCFKSQWHDQAADCFAANQKKCDEKLIGEHVSQAMELVRKISPDE
jgi:hypothetical protein